MIVFYSWQSDFPGARNFIKQCLDTAIKRLNKEISIAEADRADDIAKVELDQDTKGVLGIPDVAATILRKIDKCDVLLSDVSFSGSSIHNDKLYPNSNVLIELGYGLNKLGYERIILVMDSASGAPDKLPFDLRHKRQPNMFNSKAADLSKEKERFTAKLFEILQAYLRTHPTEPVDAVDIQLKLQYKKEDIQHDQGVPAIRQRLFRFNLIAKNKGLKTLRGYTLEISIPKPIVLPNSQTGTRTDQQSDSDAIFQFPISQTNPLPELLPGRELSMTQILGIVSERHLEFKDAVLAGQMKVTFYCDGISPVSRSYSMKDLDPFRLMEITNSSCQTGLVHELKLLDQSGQ
jgi:hypothetical protein